MCRRARQFYLLPPKPNGKTATTRTAFGKAGRISRPPPSDMGCLSRPVAIRQDNFDAVIDSRWRQEQDNAAESGVWQFANRDEVADFCAHYEAGHWAFGKNCRKQPILSLAATPITFINISSVLKFPPMLQDILTKHIELIYPDLDAPALATRLCAIFNLAPDEASHQA